jgi:hypothetical protein
MARGRTAPVTPTATAEAFLAGSPAIIPRPTIPVIPSMAAAVTAEVGVMGAAAEMAVVEAIEGAGGINGAAFDLAQ